MHLPLKFIYSEKATKFCEISTAYLFYVVPVKSTVEILQNFVAFSECMTFIGNVGLIQIPRCLKKDSTHLCTYQQMCLHPHPLYSIMSLIIRMNILRVCMQASVRFLQVCRVVRILGLCEAM